MTYATRADLVERFGEDEVAQREAMLSANAADRALNDASAEMDGYLARVMSLPMAVIPDALKRIACDVARYRLLGDAATDDARGRYKDAVATLRDIADGRMSLGISGPSGSPGASLVEMTTSKRVFSRGNQ